MKPSVTAVAAVLAFCWSEAWHHPFVTRVPALYGQAKEAHEASPAQLVANRFVELDTTGARLTAKGWRDAETLFDAAGAEPFKPAVTIIARHYGFSKQHENSQEAQFYFGYEELARIDAKLRFIPIRTAIEVRKFIEFKVVPAKSPQVQTGGASANGAAEWRIQGSQPQETLITPEAAVRYVTRMRDETTDPGVKANANRTLNTLRDYVRH